MIDDILQLIGNDKRHPSMGNTNANVDLRAMIEAGIARIAAIKPAHRRTLDRRIKNSKRLQSALKEAGVDISVLPAVDEPTGKVTTRKKMLAAELACNWLIDYGGRGRAATMTEGGCYRTLAAMLYRAATDQDADLKAACAAHLKTVGLPALPRGPRKKLPRHLQDVS